MEEDQDELRRQEVFQDFCHSLITHRTDTAGAQDYKKDS